MVPAAWARNRQGVVGLTVLTRIVALVAACAQGIGPQDTSAARAPWALWGTIAPIGFHSAGGELAIALGLTGQLHQRIVSVRLTMGGDEPLCDTSDCQPFAADLSALFGYGTPIGRPLQLSAAAGLGYAGLEDHEGLGLAGELQAAFRPARFLGLGVYGYGNTVGPQYGVSFGIQLGRVR